MILDLIPLDKHWAREIAAEGDDSLRASCSNFDDVAEFLGEAVDAHIALYEKTDAVAPWIAYLARQPHTRAFVGICSFKDKCRDGRVEIAYFTFPPYRSHGYGGAMAAQLVDLALRHPDVGEIVAHSSPKEGESARILRGLGFARDGVVHDPEDGTIWRWSLHRGAVRTAQYNLAPIAKAVKTLTLLLRTARA